jgi:UDPglucose 6-dehydrogenase
MGINRDQRRRIIQKLRDLLGTLDCRTVGVLGLAFKPNTDDMREAPAVELIHLLQNEGANIRAYDPVAMDVARQTLSAVAFCADPYEVAQGCDALIVVTEWNEFKHLDMGWIKQAMHRPVLIDGRNLYDPATMQVLGFTYRGVGRGY